MKKTLRILAMLAVAVTVIFAAASSASASEIKDLQLAQTNGPISITNLKTTSTTSTITFKWDSVITEPGYTVDQWYLCLSNNGQPDAKITQGNSYVNSLTIENIPETGAYFGKVYLICTAKGPDGILRPYNFTPTPIAVFTKYSKKDFYVYSQDGGKTFKVYYKPSEYATGAMVEIRTVGGTHVKTIDANDSFTLSSNKAYKFRIKPYAKTLEDTEEFGSWSSYRYVDKVSATFYLSTSYNGCKIKLKGLSNVKYKIYVSTSSSNLGTLTKTVTPKSGKYVTYTINKKGSSSMKKGKTYYVNIIPYIKGYKSDLYGYKSFYNTYY